MLISIVVAIGVPLIFLYIIWALEIYAISRVELLIGALLWGVLAFGLAFGLHSWLVAESLATYEQITLGIAPVLEELLKAVFIVWLASRLQLRYAVDGTAYGFAVGTGFAVAENLLYIGSNPDYALDIAVARVLSTSLVHAFNSAVVGTLAGGTLYLGARARLPRLLGGMLLVIVSHAVFNFLANRIEGLPLIIVGILFGLGGTAIIIAVIGWSLRSERRWIERDLVGRVSAGEVAATLNPQEVAQTLAQHRRLIGERRADLIQKYVALQAQYAIVRKSLALNQRPRNTPRLLQHLEGIEHQLKALRSAMGLYTWMWLRRVLPSDESDVWAHLDGELSQEEPVLKLLVELGQRQARVSAAELAARKALLRKQPIFSELSEEDLEDLALLLRSRRYDLGDVVIQQQQVDDRLYCVASGSLVVSAVDENGNETILQGYARGDMFGELSMLDLGKYPATVLAVDDVHLYALSRSDFITLIYAKPQVGLEMMRQLAGEIRRQTSLMLWIQKTTAEAGTSGAAEAYEALLDRVSRVMGEV